jgi:hypothetical protein
MNSRKPPVEGNNGTRVAIICLLRPAMHKTLLEMFQESKGDGGSTGTFENFLVELLENVAADFRLKQWRSQHANERETIGA